MSISAVPRPVWMLTESYNFPINCGGVLVYPGDVVVADGDGVIVVPRKHALEVGRLARQVNTGTREVEEVATRGSASRWTRRFASDERSIASSLAISWGSRCWKLPPGGRNVCLVHQCFQSPGNLRMAIGEVRLLAEVRLEIEELDP